VVGTGLCKLLGLRVRLARQSSQLVHVAGDFDETAAPAHGGLGHDVTRFERQELRVLRAEGGTEPRKESAGRERIAAASRARARHETSNVMTANDLQLHASTPIGIAHFCTDPSVGVWIDPRFS